MLDHALQPWPEARLADLVGSMAPELPLGTGTSFYVLLHGVAQHDAYHAGQIALLKKALAAQS